MLLEFKALWNNDTSYVHKNRSAKYQENKSIKNDDLDYYSYNKYSTKNKIMGSNDNDNDNDKDNDDNDNDNDNTDVLDMDTNIQRREPFVTGNTERLNDVSSSSTKSSGKQRSVLQSQDVSQYSEYDSFYHCDSDDDICEEKDIQLEKIPGNVDRILCLHTPLLLKY
jgi:hypothetical protein